LHLLLPPAGSQLGSIRYEHGSTDILLLRISESVVHQTDPGPAIVKTNFSELIDGQRAGTYVLTTQGAAVGDLVYVRQKDKRTYTFYEDLEATMGAGCKWAVKSGE
jgi:hypothetical protein